MPIVEYPDNQWYLRFWHKPTEKITKIPVYPFFHDNYLYQHIRNIHKNGKTYHESQDMQLEIWTDEKDLPILEEVSIILPEDIT